MIDTAVRTVTVTDRGLRLSDGRILPMFSGAVHHWRHDPADWPRILDAVASLGLTSVDTYVPWSVHDRGDDPPDFTGNLDVARFLRMVQERGLYAVVRPGPHQGAELLDSGLPMRVVSDARLQALRCNGVPYTLPTATHHIRVPSYFSDHFLAAVDRWYDSVVAQLAPLQHPDGPIVAVQVDNEHGYFFQSHPYALDYHPQTLDAYRDWLVRRHGALDAVNALYGTAWDGLEDVDPPRDAGDEPEVRRLDWLRWREEALRITLRRLRDGLCDRGLDRVPTFHNDFPRLDTPLDSVALERSDAVDVAAIDVYAARPGAGFVADIARHIAAGSRLPWMAEMGAGWLAMPWLLPMRVGPADAELVWLVALLTGARACNFFMTVERDRWYGSPVDRHGNVRAEFGGLLRRVMGLREEVGLDAMERTAPVLLVENREQTLRREARATLGGLVPAFSAQMPFDFQLTRLPHADDAAVRSFDAAVRAVLDRNSVDHDHASSSALPDLSRYACIVMPAAEVADAAAWERLREAASKGASVFVGPQLPVLDGALRPHGFDAEGITVLEDPDALQPLLPRPPFTVSEGPVRLRHWSGPRGEVLAAFNHSGEPCVATITAAAPAELASRWNDAVGGGVAHPALTVTMPAWGAQVWTVSR
ncbi:MAG TPA: beta-galactosidase [Candidatus Angelobacter sp.]|jgi:beta-galactosidase|nr:beta-galactosidase [Candidatus Angelobacter sp.]